MVVISSVTETVREITRFEPRLSKIIVRDDIGEIMLGEVDLSWNNSDNFLKRAKLIPIDQEKSKYSIAYFDQSNSWKKLDIIDSLEGCLQFILEDPYQVFFDDNN